MFPYARSRASVQTLIRMNGNGGSCSKNWKQIQNFQLQLSKVVDTLPTYKSCCTFSVIHNMQATLGSRFRYPSKSGNNLTWKYCFQVPIRNVSSRRDQNTTRLKGKKLQSMTEKGSSEVTNKLSLIENEWDTVYRFNHIRAARVFQKLKIYQTAITCGIMFPASLGLFAYGVAPVEAIAFTLGTSLFACGMLYVIGQFCARLIGIIYVSTTDNQLVRIAHLNFWGNREDQVFTKSEFIPFSELPDNVSDAYVNVRFYSDSETKLHICVRYGSIYNKKEFESIFGTHAGIYIVEKNAVKDTKK